MADKRTEDRDISKGRDADFGAPPVDAQPASPDSAGDASARDADGTSSDGDILSHAEQPGEQRDASAGSDDDPAVDAQSASPDSAGDASARDADGTASDDDILSQLGLLEQRAGAGSAPADSSVGSDDDFTADPDAPPSVDAQPASPDSAGDASAQDSDGTASDGDILDQLGLLDEKSRVDREEAFTDDELSKASIDFEGLDVDDDLQQLEDAAEQPAPATDAAPDNALRRSPARRPLWRYVLYGAAGAIVLAGAALTGALLVSRPPAEQPPIAPADDLLPQQTAEPVIEDGITVWKLAPFVVPTDTSDGQVRLLRITLSMQLEFVPRRVIVGELTAIRSQVYDRLCQHDAAAFQSRDERARITAALTYAINAVLDADLVKAVTVADVTVL